MDPRFEQFIQDRRYLTNVSPATIEWYKQSLRWLNNSAPDEAELKDFAMRMRDRGLKAASCNCRIRAVNAFLKWSGSPLKVPRLKEPQLILPTFSLPDIQKIAAWKPKGFCAVRLHVFVLLLADIGCRSGEAMAAMWTDVDFDNLLIKLHGKGGKDRLVPFSLELRRHLWPWKRPNSVFCAGGSGQIPRSAVCRDDGRGSPGEGLRSGDCVSG